MSYQIKEIFYTLQGEGANTGRPAVFCRFAGCNLWSGREEDRANATCKFCDTDFVGTDGTLGGKFVTAAELAAQIAALWPVTAAVSAGSVIDAGTSGGGATSAGAQRLVVLTGGEPLLQVDAALIDALHAQQFEIAVETNGTIAAPPGLDWICVSPKAGATWVQREGQELKVIWPQPGINLAELARGNFSHRFLQPMDNVLQRENTEACIAACLADPVWRLSLQTHKLTGIR